MTELIATVEDGKASVKEQSVLVPFVYGKGYGFRLIVHDLGISSTNQPGQDQTRHDGIKIELLGNAEEAAIDLPPDVVQNFRKWLSKLLFLRSPQKKGAMPMKSR
jgi:hypothetical protein